jgi:D-threo-aldose 1-dehydrogenase
MRSRRLRRAIELTELGLGAAQFGNLRRETTDEEAAATVDAAWAAGIRYFDTAPHYGLGLSERRLGAALATRSRDEYVVSTKVGRLLVPNPEGAGKLDDADFVVPATLKRAWDFSRDGILRSVDESLERLGLDTLDIVYLHDPDEHWEAASTTGIDALIELRGQGVIGAIGAGMNQSAMITEFIRRCDVDVMMLAGRYTLIEQGALDELLPLAEERGVGIVAAAIYNSGLLSSPQVRSHALYNYAQAPREVIERATAIAEVCERHGVTLPEAAVAFPLRHPAVVSVVIGTRTPDQLVSSVERYDAEIPEPLWAELAALGLVREPPAAALSGSTSA